MVDKIEPIDGSLIQHGHHNNRIYLMHLHGAVAEEIGEFYRRGVKTAYTIARVDSRAISRVFQKTGYRYAGRLIKNSQIGGRIRSMTIWYKRVQPESLKQ
jgi:hypothetical protein